MSQVLSQSEVDALLMAVSEGEVAADGANGGGGDDRNDPGRTDERVVVSYDLTSQDRIMPFGKWRH